jgi:hypothetical protein
MRKDKGVTKMISTLKYIWTHALNKNQRFVAIKRFAFWQISSRIWGGEVDL